MAARLVPLVLALGLAVVASGCLGGGDPARLGEDALPRLVLAPADVPGAFERFDHGRQTLFETPRGPRGDPQRFGRVGGWKARYRRPGSSETRGPLVVESRAELFESSGGAADELLEVAREAPSARKTEAVGDEGLLRRTVQPGVPRRVVGYVLVWRSGEVVGTLAVDGFEGRLREADVIRLARLQQERIDAARQQL